MNIINFIKNNGIKDMKLKMLDDFYHLTPYQKNAVFLDYNEKLTIFPSQIRREGTSTAVLLKLYSDIFIRNKHIKYGVFCTANMQAEIMRNRFEEILRRQNKDDEIVVSRNKFIRLRNGTEIFFISMIGARTATCGCRFDEIIVDDYRIDNKHEDNMSLFHTLNPFQIFLFEKGCDPA